MMALMAGCHQQTSTKAGGASLAAKPGGPIQINAEQLDGQVEDKIGGMGTCVYIQDTTSGRELYHFGMAQACLAKLPPCSTFDIANTLIGLDAGTITPTTLYKWDGSSQPYGLWQQDTDLNRAFKVQVGWWFQRLATSLGHDRYVQALKALDYGDHDPTGLANGFWLGPQAGGFLTVTPEQQISFIRRFYAGALPVKPASLAVVQGLTEDETRTDAKGAKSVISGRAATCASVPDGSREVSWWVGRMQTPQRDMVISVSVEATEPLPGREIQHRLEDIFVGSGLIPPEAP